MKKIISAIISVSIITASAAVPALAEYTAPDISYDIETVNEQYEKDGTVENPIDGTKAFKSGESFEKIFSTSIDTTKEFYLGFDFCFDNENGDIEIPKFKSDGVSNDKVGPIITYGDVQGNPAKQLRTQVNSSSYQALGALEIGAWYSAEIEGRTGMGEKYTTFRLYSYSEGVKTLVQETTSFNMRNLSSENRSFNGMQIKNASIDNVLLIQEKPDTITVSSAREEMNAGTDVAFDYVMTRLDKEFNKYPVTWSVYDENDSVQLSDENITISNEGILSAGIHADGQNVTVRATVTFGDKELYGSKQIKINAVDVSDEKFDEITVSGPEKMRAGEESTFTVKALKGGEDVTDTLTEADIEWGIYDSLGITKNNNINMGINDGVLTIDNSVIPQNITVRASSASGKVYGSAPVEVAWSDDQKETVISYNACETELTNTSLVSSWDGSKAYATNDNITFGFGDQSTYAVTDVDIKFDAAEGHGLTLYNNNGSENSNIRFHNGALAQQTGSSSWMTIIEADQFEVNSWYHIEFLYLNGAESGYHIYKYNDDGEKTLVKTMTNCNRRNDKPYGKIVFTAGLVIDNFKTALALPDVIGVKTESQYMFVGGTMQCSVSKERNGLPMKDTAGIKWSVLDSEGLPVIDGSISVDDNGLITSDAMASAQTVKVRASADNGVFGETPVILQVSEIFEVTNLGINEDKTKIVRMYVTKHFYYNDDAMFIIAIKDKDGLLKALKSVNTFGDRLNIGANELAVDFPIPEDFDPENDIIETFVWTRF
ncbi:MAG: hypothetical protein HFE49_08925 [Clostridia bacterium]|nr:hypothetical protein [Clostridia bacterium]